MKTLLVLLNIYVILSRAEIYKDNKWLPEKTAVSGNYASYPENCTELLEGFAQFASDLTFCAILNARPISLCEKCIDQYVKFHNKYQELITKDVNGTSCGSIYMSQDRLNVVMEYHNSIADVWSKGNCKTCYNWDNNMPTLKNETITFNKMYYDTKLCIDNYKDNVCEKCFDKYVALDDFYKTLSTDAVGVDSVCMDIVDAMNATRSLWSKDLNCCNLRRKPEIAFLCCASIVSLLPFIYYLLVRFCGPIRDLPNVLKQSRFKQSFLRSTDSNNE